MLKKGATAIAIEGLVRGAGTEILTGVTAPMPLFTGGVLPNLLIAIIFGSQERVDMT
jgi:hypothetical protein